MERDLSRLSDRRFDIAVVGGGVLGAFVAWCAARRGKSVALVDKNDFASGTTEASGKVLHGGIRYLQEPSLSLLREAQKEQEVIGRLAPRLVRPLRFLVPSTGDSRLQTLPLRGATWAWCAYRALDGNDLALGPTEFISAEGEATLLPALRRLNRSRALVYGDLQLRSPERLVVALIHSAASMGAVVANYAKVTGFVVSGTAVRGVEGQDRLNRKPFSIEARHVVNAAGVWIPELERLLGTDHYAGTRFGKGAHVLLDRPEPEVALAIPIPDASPASQPGETRNRRVFVMPWEGKTLVGATYTSFRGAPDECAPGREEIRDFLRCATRHWPGLSLTSAPVVYAYSGLYPIFESESAGEGFQASLRPRIVDHGTEDGISGLISAMSVKLTTARSLAEEILEMIDQEHTTESGSWPPGECAKSELERARPTPLPDPDRLTDELARDLSTLREMVAAAVEEEMAVTLEDFLFRRTWIGHLGRPPAGWLKKVAGIMGRSLGWDEDRTEREIAGVKHLYHRRLS